MLGTIFINCRQEDWSGTDGRLHGRLMQVLGQGNLFANVQAGNELFPGNFTGA